MAKSTKLGIDFGITNTDVVISKDSELVFKSFVSKGATINFLKEIIDSCIGEVTTLTKIGVTGGKHLDLPSSYEQIKIDHFNEIDAIVKGANNLYKPKESSFMVISLGSGSACAIKKNDEIFHAGGTGLGGGTIKGLCSLIIRESSHEIINSLASKGEKEKVDLLLKDVVSGPIGNLPETASAVNFGKSDFSDCAKEDLAAGIINMVGQTILKTAITSAYFHEIKKVYVIGRTQKYNLMKKILEDGFKLAEIEVAFNEKSEYAICMGTI